MEWNWIERDGALCHDVLINHDLSCTLLISLCNIDIDYVCACVCVVVSTCVHMCVDKLSITNVNYQLELFN